VRRREQRRPDGGEPTALALAQNWRSDFLAKLAETSNVRCAAEFAGVNPTTVYDLRRRDASFAQRWLDALCEGYDNLEMEMLYHLRTGEITTFRKIADEYTEAEGVSPDGKWVLVESSHDQGSAERQTFRYIDIWKLGLAPNGKDFLRMIAILASKKEGGPLRARLFFGTIPRFRCPESVFRCLAIDSPVSLGFSISRLNEPGNAARSADLALPIAGAARISAIDAAIATASASPWPRPGVSGPRAASTDRPC
jgi:hypothetical protein